MSNSYKRLSRMHRNVLISLVVLLPLGLSGFLLLRKKQNNTESIIRGVLNNSPYRALRDFIIAQAKLETANFSSNVFKRANNAFGMRNAVIRVQLGYKVEGDPYRHYSTVSESVLDYLDLLQFNKFPLQVQDAQEFVEELWKDGYFGNDSKYDYLKALKSWL